MIDFTGMSSSSLTSTSMPINQGGGRSTSDAVDSRLMPPPQGPASGPGPSMGLKKRKSSKKGYTEYGRHASAPSTPTPHGQVWSLTPFILSLFFISEGVLAFLQLYIEFILSETRGPVVKFSSLEFSLQSGNFDSFFESSF